MCEASLIPLTLLDGEVVSSLVRHCCFRCRLNGLRFSACRLFRKVMLGLRRWNVI